MDLQLNTLILAGSPGGTEDFDAGTGGDPDDAI